MRLGGRSGVAKQGSDGEARERTREARKRSGRSAEAIGKKRGSDQEEARKQRRSAEAAEKRREQEEEGGKTKVSMNIDDDRILYIFLTNRLQIRYQVYRLFFSLCLRTRVDGERARGPETKI